MAHAQVGCAAELDLKDEVQGVIPLEALSGMAKPSGDATDEIVRQEKATSFAPDRQAKGQTPLPVPGGDRSATHIPGRQFRQLFSQLESGNRSPIYG